jgi:hypothetical protein
MSGFVYEEGRGGEAEEGVIQYEVEFYIKNPRHQLGNGGLCLGNLFLKFLRDGNLL